jgi:F-type H+-transporting ATPase subunit delta
VTQLRVTKRYVQGIIGAAQAQGLVDAVEQALQSIDSVIVENQDFRNLLFHPMISRDRKKNLLHKIIGDHAPAVVKTFIDLVVEKKREHILASVYGEFKAAADDLRGIMRARVTAAREPTQEQVENLKAQLERALHKKVLINIQIDKQLLGGMQVMIGTYILDGSISGRLGRLSKHLQEEVKNIKSAA